MATSASALRRAVWAFVKRDFKLWSYFKVDFFINNSVVFTNLIIYGLLATFRSASVPIGGYGTDYVSFVIIGLVLEELISGVATGPYEGLLESFWANRLEMLMMSPLRLETFVIGLSLGKNVKTFVRATFYIIFGIILFDFKLGANPEVLLAAGVFLLGLPVLIGIGLLSASMIYHVDARGGSDPVQLFLRLTTGFAAGVYFPLAVLPQWGQVIGSLLPHTYILDAVRHCLLLGGKGGATLPVHRLLPFGPITCDMITLVFMGTVFFPLGWYALKAGIAKARRDGRLARWV